MSLAFALQMLLPNCLTSDPRQHKPGSMSVQNEPTATGPDLLAANAAGSTFRTKAILPLSIFFTFMMIVAAGWVNDDAYITLRTVYNFVHGYGLRYNVAERVQAFTHPLWLMLLVPLYALVRDAFLVAALAGLACAAGTMLILAKRRDSLAAALIVILGCSKAFVEYSTSGLENSLSHLLIAAFFAAQLNPNRQRAFAWSCLWAGLCVVNRQDLVLLFLGPLCWMIYELRSARAVLPGALLAIAPTVAWECFSIIYYGFPFPNTAYAKLGTGVSRMEMIRKGAAYILSSLRRDFVTIPFTVLICCVAAKLERRRLAISAAASIVLYYLYIIWAGGDFMSGRFTSAPFVAAVSVTAICAPAVWARYSWKAAASAALLCAISPGMVLRGAKGYGGPIDNNPYIDKYLVADERPFYAGTSSLLPNLFSNQVKYHVFSIVGRAARARQAKLIVYPNLGYCGFHAGPEVYVLDPMALADPLLSHLPMRTDYEVRQGHYMRAVPAGYKDSIRDDNNQIADPKLHEFYDKIRQITRGEIWSAARFKTIWQMNTGQFADLLPKPTPFKGPKKRWFTPLPEVEDPRKLDWQK